MAQGSVASDPRFDEAMMREALSMAELGLGWTSPNPPVGALIVRDGQIIGRGAHLSDGSEHAELLALRSGDARGADCYTSLEPCSHHGRQPPCTDALIAAGVRRVIYGAVDSDPRSANRARQILEQAGIAVETSVLGEDCERFLDFYHLPRRLGRPFVHLKLALSADGKMACANGASQWLSGPQSLGYAHYLRQKYDAIMVAWRTVLADDPRLSARHELLAEYSPLAARLRPRNPLRVVLDPRFEILPQLGRLRITDFSGSFRSELPQLLIIGRNDARPGSAALPPGTVVEGAAADAAGQLRFTDILSILWRYGAQSLLVEGGPGLIRSMLAQGVADKLSLVFTPLLIGGDGLGFTPPRGVQSIAESLRINKPRPSVMGDDILLEGYPDWTGDTKL